MEIIKIVTRTIRHSQFKGQLYLMFQLITIYSFSRIGVAYLYNPLLDLLNQETYKSLSYVIIGLVTLSILSVYLMQKIQLLQVNISFKLEKELVQAILKQAPQRTLLEIEEEGLGSWLTYLSDDSKKYGQLIAENSTNIWLVISKFLAALLFGLIVSPKLTFAIIIFSALSVFIPKYFSKKLVSHKRMEQKSRDSLNETLLVTIQSRDFVKVANILPFTLEVFNKSYRSFNKVRLDYSRIAFFVESLSIGISFLMTTFWVAIAFMMIQSNQLSIGEFIGFMVLDNSFIGIFSELPNHISQAMSNYASYKRIEHLIIVDNSFEINQPKANPSAFKSLKAEGLAINYSKFTLSLTDLSLTLKPGLKIYLSGASGTGKSTFLKMITGLYPISEGKITLNDQEIESIDILANYMTYMPQVNPIFDDSIRENILLGRSISDEYFNQILHSAGLINWVCNLPDGADTMIHKGMFQDLSEGQIQRIAFARAIVSEAPVFILDEPTSALDEKNTTQLMNYIHETKQAVLLVSHNQESIPKSFQRINL